MLIFSNEFEYENIQWCTVFTLSVSVYRLINLAHESDIFSVFSFGYSVNYLDVTKNENVNVLSYFYVVSIHFCWVKYEGWVEVQVVMMQWFCLIGYHSILRSCLFISLAIHHCTERVVSSDGYIFWQRHWYSIVPARFFFKIRISVKYSECDEWSDEWNDERSHPNAIKRGHLKYIFFVVVLMKPQLYVLYAWKQNTNISEMSIPSDYIYL